jgi:anti-sigma factor RsiW
MNCPEFESRILDLLENQLPAGERAEVEAHLAACPACRAWAAEWRQLDAALVRAVPRPKLSADFEARLREQIAAVASPALAERKRQAEADHAARLGELRRWPHWLPQLLDTLGWAALAGWVGGALVRWSPALIGLLPARVMSTEASWWTALLGSAVFLLIGLAVAFPQPRRRLAAWF